MEVCFLLASHWLLVDGGLLLAGFSLAVSEACFLLASHWLLVDGGLLHDLHELRLVDDTVWWVCVCVCVWGGVSHRMFQAV